METASPGETGPTTAGEKNTNKPKDSAFKQQRLPAWQPILTAGTVLPTFFVIGVAFIPIGIGMMYFSAKVMEKSIPYTEGECMSSANIPCSTVIANVTAKEKDCQCNVNFTIDKNWDGDVFIYYELENFYQNHRRYVKSRDDNQLLGKVKENGKFSTECKPFHNCGKKQEDCFNGVNGTLPLETAYFPCGAIANSLFSDEITLKYFNNVTKEYEKVDVKRTGIAWESDKDYKFSNGEEGCAIKGKCTKDELKTKFGNYARPKDWKKDIWELDIENDENNGLQNEDLIVWMRTAALPNFRKLYRKIDQKGSKNGQLSEQFKTGMPAGEYQLAIDYNFEVVQFKGKKNIVLSTTTILGGKNPFLGIAYIAVGCICLVLGVVFLFVHIKCGKQTNEIRNLTSATQFHN